VRRQSHLKRLPDGRAMLNLACGTKLHRDWNNVDFSPYAFLASHRALARFLRRIGLLSRDRHQAIEALEGGILRHDLRRGIPYEDGVFDVVYHSHFLEHVERECATFILAECYRILKSGGVIRVAVPDLQALVLRYTATLSRLQGGDGAALEDHQTSVSRLLEQMVRTRAVGTKQQRRLVRAVERALRGGPEGTGERHLWMYDRYTLGALLAEAGFTHIRVESPDTSRIPDWSRFCLDVNADGSPHKCDSLYVEAMK